MASGLLGRLFGGKEPASAEVAEAVAGLAKLTQPALTAARGVLAEIVPVLFDQASHEAAPVIEPAEAQAKLAGGIPLLRGIALPLDKLAFRQRWLAVCRAVERQNELARNVAGAFAELDPGTLLAQVLAGRPEQVHAHAERLQLDPSLTATVLRLTALPALASIASDLTPLRSHVHWEHGYCPTCGSWPLLGELRGLEQIRFLRCGLCASDWEFARLRCPFCGNHDHRQLGFFHVEGEENRCRAATCEECHGYVKVVSTLAPLTAPSLLVTDLATLHLDLAAADRGYLVP